MNANAELTVDSLIDAYVTRDKHKNDHEDLREYHEKRLQIMLSLLGCDVDKRRAEIEAQTRKPRSKTDQHYDINSRATIWFMENCVELLNTNHSPFRSIVYLEGKPPKIVRDLSAKYEEELRALEGKINQVNRKVLKDILIFLFPGVENRKVKAAKLYEMGLPKNEPDPVDYL